MSNTAVRNQQYNTNTGNTSYYTILRKFSNKFLIFMLRIQEEKAFKKSYTKWMWVGFLRCFFCFCVINQGYTRLSEREYKDKANDNRVFFHPKSTWAVSPDSRRKWNLLIKSFNVPALSVFTVLKLYCAWVGRNSAEQSSKSGDEGAVNAITSLLTNNKGAGIGEISLLIRKELVMAMLEKSSKCSRMVA